MKTVYVGLSGGVDSSVAAALLLEQGFRVVGVYMKNWTTPIGGVDCPWKIDLADAKAVAVRLGIPFKVFDFQAQYKAKVVDYMVAEYLAGRTPNPDVMCNQEIKFKLFLDTALADGADLIATGHYARIRDGQLLTGIDTAKDQSYFLYRVNESALRHALMPIGEYDKPTIRAKAAALGLVTAAKPDSQGVCFVGEVGMRDFLRAYLPNAPHKGPVVTQEGLQMGEHDGAVFYTIGQRHGLGIGGGKPYYVIGKDMEANTVTVTDNPSDLQLSGDRFAMTDMHWINGRPDLTKSYQVRCRYRAALIDCGLTAIDGGIEVTMDSSERAVAPGQSAVIYDGEIVLGGGIIDHVTTPAISTSRH
jgi:tRNA-uridine 2-sulfurtransferase